MECLLSTLKHTAYEELSQQHVTALELMIPCGAFSGAGGNLVMIKPTYIQT
jgi:hypothetical protein